MRYLGRRPQGVSSRQRQRSRSDLRFRARSCSHGPATRRPWDTEGYFALDYGGSGAPIRRAIAASSETLARGRIHTTELNPSATFTSALARRVADGLAAAGWKMKAVLTDNGSEFRSQQFGNAVRTRGAKQRFIRAGRPQTNGCVERVQRTILEECWRPTFARSLVPKSTALRRDLEQYLDYYNWDRGHTGRRSNGNPPSGAVYASRKMRPR